MYFIPIFISVLFWPIVIIFLISRFRRKSDKTHPSQDKEWYMSLSLCKEDAVSQLFLLLAFFFLGTTLVAFNRDLGDPVSWKTIVFLTSALGIFGSYYMKSIYTLIFSLIGITSWWAAQAGDWATGKAVVINAFSNPMSADWHPSQNIQTSTIFAGLTLIALLFYSLGRLHEKQVKFKRLSLVYLFLGIIPVTFALFIFSSKLGIGGLEEMLKGASLIGSWQIMTSLIIIVVSLVGVSVYTFTQKLLSVYELLAVLLLACLFGSTALMPEQQMFVSSRGFGLWSGDGDLSGNGIIWAVIFNFAVFFELLGLIFSGYMRRETWLVNLGALFMFLLIIVKYFDWFFTFLDKSLFFIGAGILLFAVGWFMEKGRRRMIADIQAQPAQVQQ